MGKVDFGNTATNGGAIYVGSGTVTLSVNSQHTDKSLNYNTATNGGAIYVNTGGSASVAGYDFTSNSALTSGGAIYSKAELTVTSGNFVSNTSGSLGGAIYVLGTGTKTVTGATFYGNRAEANGGAVACTTATLTMTDCSFNTVQNETTVGNTAKTNGGLAYVNGGGTLSILTTLTGLSFDGNTDDGQNRALVAVNHSTLGTSTIQYSSSYGVINTDFKASGNVIVATEE